MNNRILKELNESQREAVTYIDGPQLVVAGAGSGKTRVLTYKIAYLISQGIPANRILALTFTNKASDEMKIRIDNLLGYDASRSIWMGTFHSIFGRMLRIDSERIGFTRNFTIYDSADSLNLIKSIIKEMNLNDDFYKPKSVCGRISAAKNNLITAEAYAQNNDYIIEDTKENREHFSTIYTKYSQRCKQSNVMDFDDLLVYTNILFKVNPDVLDRYRNLFSYILVDEYQDTNFAQYLIIKRLSEVQRKLCVVGDDAQSIYSFRGAKIQNILNFKNDYQDYKLYKLEQNYRSTQTIVNAANSLIAKNTQQIPKTIFSKNDAGTKIKVEKAMTDGLEGIIVAETISRMLVEDHFNPSDFAILYRTNAQSRIMEESLRKFNIPYRVFGGLSFYQRKEIKDVIAYIRLSINHNDIEAFRRIINYPSRKIGNTTVDKILNYSANTNTPIWNLISEPYKYNLDINSGTTMKISQFAALISYFSEKSDAVNAYDFMTELVNKSGISQDLFSDKTPEGVSRYENIQELLNGVKNFCETNKEKETFNGTSIIDYLENISILTDLDNEEDENPDKLSMMTIHSAKGLEFTNVFVVGVEENLFPNALSAMSLHELEEERRLFYVAITRAMKNLIICYSVNRFRFGNMTTMEPSRFIKEINSEYLDWPLQHKKNEIPNFSDERKKYSDYSQNNRNQNKTKQPEEVKPYTSPRQKKLISIDKISSSNNVNTSINISDYKSGMRIRHNSFGEGTIELIAEAGDDTKATVKFDSGETKTLLLKYAKLVIL